MKQVSGTFEVKLTPQPAEDGIVWGRQRIAKSFSGPLEGASIGEMVAIRTATPGSAGYVALEQVNATLEGRSGSFFLQHSGQMDRGQPQLSVSVVPDSGTGELAGIKGEMSIDIADGQHNYTFRYTLPEK